MRQEGGVAKKLTIFFVQEPRMHKTIIEPFRIKVIEPIRMTTVEQRKKLIKEVYYNVFQLRSVDVIIDLLTDSGTSAQSAEQMAALMRGDESYAGSSSFYRFIDAVRTLMPFKHIFPTHQGRAAERILAIAIAKNGARVPNNTFFDTTRANFEAHNIIADDLPIAEGLQPATYHPFKGNMDIEKLKAYLSAYAADVPLVMLTITNNAGGGQPVSLANIRAVKALCRQYNKPLFIDSCRFAENAMFIKRREPGYENKSVKEIVKEIFTYADGMTMSAKKDPFGNIGGWLAMNDDDWADRCRAELIISEGFATYGGLAGRDLDAIAVGLQEATDEEYLNYRLRTIEYFGEALIRMGVPIVTPVGGHALFIDAKGLLPHIPVQEFPGLALVVALYEQCGIRGCEIGSLMFAGRSEGGGGSEGSEGATAEETPMELVRLALPRRVYTQSHIDFAIENIEAMLPDCKNLCGYKIIWQPKYLRHFTAKFAKVSD